MSAKQISFSKQPKEDHYLFNYQWLDHDKKQQSVSFSLTKQALFERFRMIKTYQDNFVKKSVMYSLKKQLKKNKLNGVQVLFLPQNDKTIIQVKGLENTDVELAYEKISVLQKKATENYFKQNYYQLFHTYDGERGVKIDHVNIVNDSVEDFTGIKANILNEISNKSSRNIVNYILSFVQNIPYSTLESRITSSGAGFNPPAKLLWENQGDCDSKVALTATMLRALIPKVKMIIVYIDQHAFMGIAIPAQSGEKRLNHKGINYILAEPTGPALYRLGILSPESRLAVEQGRYVAESF